MSHLELLLQAACGRLLFLLDGLDEITGVADLSTLSPKYSREDVLTPLELTQVGSSELRAPLVWS